MKDIIRIALVDDHKLIRSGIRSILTVYPKFQIVLEAANGKELMEKITMTKPDVVLLDLEMPVMSGKETLQEIRKVNKDIKVLVLTMHQNHSFIIQMMELGANGYLVKDSEPDEVVLAIEKAYHNHFYFSDRVSRAMLSGITDKPEAVDLKSTHGLNEREIEVLKLICTERTTTEIGEALFLSPKTIEGYRKSLLEKSGARNIAGLVLFAVRHGLADPS